MINFANFDLNEHRNMSDIAGNVVGQMADVFEVGLSKNPTVDELGTLVGRLGKQRELQANIAEARGWMTEKLASEEHAIAQANAWLRLSGVQDALDRSVWTNDIKTPEDAQYVITGAVANWQDRTAKLITERRLGSTVHVAVGNRVMSSPTELVNPGVEHFKLDTGELPTETEYVDAVVTPMLEEAGYGVEVNRYDTVDGDRIANLFMTDNQELLEGPLVFARVANAGIQLTAQMRSQAQVLNPQYDNHSSNPMAFVLTDSFPVAETAEQLADPVNYQNPFSGIRQIAVTAKYILQMQRR